MKAVVIALLLTALVAVSSCSTSIGGAPTGSGRPADIPVHFLPASDVPDLDSVPDGHTWVEPTTGCVIYTTEAEAGLVTDWLVGGCEVGNTDQPRQVER